MSMILNKPLSIERKIDYIKGVDSLADIEAVRLIRNASLDGMTKNAYPTTELQQLRYWLANLDTLQAWLYYIEQAPIYPGGYPGSRVIGYASLRRDFFGKLWSFMAVVPEYRGQGYGKLIQHHHVRQTDENVYDEILETNVASLEMVRKSGDWRIIDRRDGLVYQVSEPSMRR
jgi:GNAT superfamily N-acetyltransferase